MLGRCLRLHLRGRMLELNDLEEGTAASFLILYRVAGQHPHKLDKIHRN